MVVGSVAVAMRVVMAAAAAAAVGAAKTPAPAARADIIPFPSPPPGPTVGRFHTLGALQCRLHPPTSGDVSPNAAAVVSPTVPGVKGWTLVANRTAPPVFVPYQPGTCASPLDDAEELAYLAAPDETEFSASEAWRRYRPSTNVSSDGDLGAEFEWAGNWLYTTAASMATDSPPVGGMLSSEWSRPHPCGTAGRRSQLVCEAEVARLLTLQRNQRFGAVVRQTGYYDVVAVTRGTVGVALNRPLRGLVIAAIDMLSDASAPNAVLTYTSRIGSTRPVLVGESALLSLGRAVLADPSWLGSSFPGGFSARVSLHHFLRGGGPPAREVSWRLGEASDNAKSSLWLQRLATLFCQPPTASFVADSSLCVGVKMREPSIRSTQLAGGRPVVSELRLSQGGFLRVPRETVSWFIQREATSGPKASCPQGFQDLGWNVTLRQPIWLLGRKSREIHATGAGSEAEVDLAGRLSTCVFDKYKRRRVKTFWLSRVEALVADLSERYRRALFQVDLPADPTSNSELLLAVLVVVPEAAAILLLLIQHRYGPRQPLHRQWREGVSLALAVAAGAAALVAVAFADVQERKGHSWRAATTHLQPDLSASDSELSHVHMVNATGRLVSFTESLIVVARTGYRPHLTRLLLVILLSTYAALLALVLVRVVVAPAGVYNSNQEADGPSAAVGVEQDEAAFEKPISRSRRRRRPRQPSIPRRRWWRGARGSGATTAEAAGDVAGGAAAGPHGIGSDGLPRL